MDCSILRHGNEIAGHERGIGSKIMLCEYDADVDQHGAETLFAENTQQVSQIMGADRRQKDACGCSTVREPD